jgi:hypothetical protein
MFYGTRDFRHLEQRPLARFWAGTLAGPAFWRARFSEIVADAPVSASGGRARSMVVTIYGGDEQAHHEQR